MLTVSDDKCLRVWDLASGRCQKNFEAQEHFVTTVAIANISPVVATGGVDTILNLFDCR